MDLKDICKFWSLIKTHHLLACNIINMMPYNGCSQMLHISLKTEKNLLSPTPDACCALLALRSIQLMTDEPRPPVQHAPVTWWEWGLWLEHRLSALLQLHLHSLLNTWLYRLGNDKCKMRWESFKFCDLVCLILEILLYVNTCTNFMCCQLCTHACLPALSTNINMSQALGCLWPLLLTWFNFNRSMDK